MIGMFDQAEIIKKSKIYQCRNFHTSGSMWKNVRRPESKTGWALVLSVCARPGENDNGDGSLFFLKGPKAIVWKNKEEMHFMRVETCFHFCDLKWGGLDKKRLIYSNFTLQFLSKFSSLLK